MTRCHATAAKEDEEEDDDELYSARKDGVGGIRSNVARETEVKRARMLQLQPHSRP